MINAPRDRPDEMRSSSSNRAPIKPRTPTEILVATVWCELLQLEEVFVTDNFFEVGGHSLVASKVIHELMVRTGIELELERFFDLDTLEQIAAELDRLKSLKLNQNGPHYFEGEL